MQQDLTGGGVADRRDLLPLPMPLMCDATSALRDRLDGRGDALLAGTAAWMMITVLALNFIYSGRAALTGVRFHTGQPTAAQL
eukprot:11749549-Heterocapsa_arctica.AAC.1